mgnify:CR=1 FL=1
MDNIKLSIEEENKNLKEDNTRLWKMIKDAQEVSNNVGLIGMVGSRAWIGQIKKLLNG